MRVACILHADPKPPVSISKWADCRGYKLLTYNFILEPQKPPLLEEIDFIIVLGGPFSTSDVKIALELNEEKKFLKKAVLLNKPIIGICFGMQILGEVLGATTSVSPVKEIGLGTVVLNNNAKEDLVTFKLPHHFEAFHFHTQMSGLPKDSTILAESDSCPRQIVRFTKLVYGLQCHLEVDFEFAKHMIVDLPEGPTLLKILSDFNFLKMHQLFYLFLDALIQQAYP